MIFWFDLQNLKAPLIPGEQSGNLSLAVNCKLRRMYAWLCLFKNALQPRKKNIAWAMSGLWILCYKSKFKKSIPNSLLCIWELQFFFFQKQNKSSISPNYFTISLHVYHCFAYSDHLNYTTRLNWKCSVIPKVFNHHPPTPQQPFCICVT